MWGQRYKRKYRILPGSPGDRIQSKLSMHTAPVSHEVPVPDSGVDADSPSLILTRVLPALRVNGARGGLDSTTTWGTA